MTLQSSTILQRRHARDDFAIIDDLAKTANVAEPPAIREIRTAPVRHNTVYEIDDMQKEVRGVLGIRNAEE